MSMPITDPWPSSCSIEADITTEPPWATPVSITRSGFTAQMISCIASASVGNWIIGRPSQEKLFMYFFSRALVRQVRASSRISRSLPKPSMRARFSLR